METDIKIHFLNTISVQYSFGNSGKFFSSEGVWVKTSCLFSFVKSVFSQLSSVSQVVWLWYVIQGKAISLVTTDCMIDSCTWDFWLFLKLIIFIIFYLFIYLFVCNCVNTEESMVSKVLFCYAKTSVLQWYQYWKITKLCWLFIFPPHATYCIYKHFFCILFTPWQSDTSQFKTGKEIQTQYLHTQITWMIDQQCLSLCACTDYQSNAFKILRLNVISNCFKHISARVNTHIECVAGKHTVIFVINFYGLISFMEIFPPYWHY